MLTIETGQAQVDELQETFVLWLQETATELRRHSLGFQGGSLEADIAFFEDRGFWYANTLLSNRHWNAFGFGNPFVSSAAITVEVNVSRTGLDRRIAGAFARDESRSYSSFIVATSVEVVLGSARPPS